MSIGGEPLLLPPPFTVTKRGRESSVVGYSIMITTIWRFIFRQERRKVMLNIDISEIVVNVNKINVS